MKELFTVLVPSDGEILTVDGLEHDGKLWLVSQWRDYPEHQASKPARMIRFDNRPHSKNEGTTLHKYRLDQYVPKAVLSGESNEGFDTLSEAQITFGIRLADRPH